MTKICMLTTSRIEHDSRILNEAETLARDYNVTILARAYQKQKLKNWPFKIKLIKFRKIPLGQLNIFSSLFSLISAALKEEADIYHAHDLDGLLCCFGAALLRRKTLIYDSHEFWSSTYPFSNLRGIHWLIPILEKILIFKIKAGITVNESIARLLEKKYHKKFLALYNYPKWTEKKRSYSIKRKFPTKKIVLHLGADLEGRGFEQMIMAAKFLPENIIILFIRGGKIEGKLNDLIRREEAQDKIAILPPVLPDQIIPTISEADMALIMTQKISLSYYYSTPNKIFQYIKAKIPILASNFPEMKKIILPDKIGEVVDPSKPREIAKGIIKIINNKEKYKNNLEKIAVQKYDWESEGQKLLNFYERLAKDVPEA